MRRCRRGNHCSFSPAHRFVALFRWREKSRRRRRGDCCWAECSGAARRELISAQGEDANTPRASDLQPLPTDPVHEPGKPSRFAAARYEPCAQQPARVGQIGRSTAPVRAQQHRRNRDRVLSPWRCGRHRALPQGRVPSGVPARPGLRNPRSPRHQPIHRREPQLRSRPLQSPVP